MDGEINSFSSKYLARDPFNIADGSLQLSSNIK
jgi:hypothetical protein